jgi:flagellar hook-length control protein FliK
VPVVAFEVLATTAPHASRKPAAQAEGSTPFSEMLDKSDKKPAAKADKSGKADKSETDAGKDAAPSQQQQPVAAKDKPHGDHAKTTAATATATKATDADPSETANPVTADATEDTTDTTANDQDTANEFVAAVADVTGIPVAPVDAPKTETKPAGNAKAGDESKDDATDKATDAAQPVTADAAPVAAVVATPAETAAAADTAPASAAPAIVTIAPGLVKAAAVIDAADGKADAVKADSKTDKPQTAVKLDTPPLLTDPLHSAKQPANPPAAQPQQAQGQAQKPAVDAIAQPAKPAHHDAPAPDAAVTAKPADTTQPVLLVQNNGLTAPQSADQAAVTATPAAPAAAPQALPVQGIAIEIAGRALDGKKSFDIRLDPPELGKIHVRLDVDHKGEVTSIITADRSDTFDLLRRDAQSLERALNDAGVKTSSNGLQFSLRDQGQQQQAPQQFANTAHVVVRDDVLDTEITAPLYRSLSGTRAGVDIRV